MLVLLHFLEELLEKPLKALDPSHFPKEIRPKLNAERYVRVLVTATTTLGIKYLHNYYTSHIAKFFNYLPKLGKLKDFLSNNSLAKECDQALELMVSDL